MLFRYGDVEGGVQTKEWTIDVVRPSLDCAYIKWDTKGMFDRMPTYRQSLKNYEF